MIKRCEEALVLTPADRARLGIAIGEERLTAAKLNEQLDREAAKRGRGRRPRRQSRSGLLITPSSAPCSRPFVLG